MEEGKTVAADMDIEAEPADFDQFTSYEDGNQTVICDRSNVQAWIKSDTVVTLDP
jgi:hypothetical protein